MSKTRGKRYGKVEILNWRGGHFCRDHPPSSPPTFLVAPAPCSSTSATAHRRPRHSSSSLRQQGHKLQTRSASLPRVPTSRVRAALPRLPSRPKQREGASTTPRQLRPSDAARPPSSPAPPLCLLINGNAAAHSTCRPAAKPIPWPHTIHPPRPPNRLPPRHMWVLSLFSSAISPRVCIPLSWFLDLADLCDKLRVSKLLEDLICTIRRGMFVLLLFLALILGSTGVDEWEGCLSTSVRMLMIHVDTMQFENALIMLRLRVTVRNSSWFLWANIFGTMLELSCSHLICLCFAAICGLHQSRYK
jgi:hypothetical protein